MKHEIYSSEEMIDDMTFTDLTAEFSEHEKIIGVVTDCIRLNIRKETSITSEILAVVDCMSEVQVDTDKSTEEWLFVCTVSGIEGFAMKKYIALR